MIENSAEFQSADCSEPHRRLHDAHFNKGSELHMNKI